MRRYNQGWRDESERHSLSARRIKTGRKVEKFANILSNPLSFNAAFSKGERKEEYEDDDRDVGIEEEEEIDPGYAKGRRDVMTVGELEKRDDLVFVNADYEVEDLKNYLGKEALEYDAFFVKENDGDYEEVWGIEGNVPYVDKNAHRVR